jgi:predicted acyl esterase
VKSSAPDTDLQVTLSEVRPDGNETYVQNGWLRASHRKLDEARSTAFDPVPTHLKADAAPLPPNTFTLVRVPIFPVAHAFRAGSRIRVTVEATGGDRPRWDFATIDKGTTTNTIALGGYNSSRLVLLAIADATAQGTPLPPPTALRGEPNRTYVPASNGG